MYRINSQEKKVKYRAAILATTLLLLAAASAFLLFFRNTNKKEAYTAYLYQNGSLLQTIDLAAVTEPYSFTVKAPDGGFNTIAVRHNAIGMTDADCPDKLCVAMGYTDKSLLPIVCLPHGLVIEVKVTEDVATDVISY